MAETRDIYRCDHEKHYKIYKDRIASSKAICEKDKAILNAYFVYLEGKDKVKTLHRIAQHIKILFEEIAKPLDSWEITDIERYMAWLNQRRDIKAPTKSYYKRTLKQFFKWYQDRDDRLESADKAVLSRTNRLYRYLKNEVKVAYRVEKIKREDILEDDDINKVLSHGFEGVSHCQRDKAFIALLYETGARAGEILGMKIKSIMKQEQSAATITLDGKTGVRNIRIVTSTPYLFTWLQEHPLRHDAESALWVGYNNRYRNEPLNYIGAVKIIRRAFANAKVKKKSNLHWFRHSSATHKATFLNEVDMCNYFGWVYGSKEAANYVHGTNGETNNKVMAHHGLIEEQHLKPKNNPISCPICKHSNEPIAEFCSQCGHALSLQTIMKYEHRVKDETSKTIELLMEIMRNPELLARFEAFKQKLQEVQK